MDEEFEEKEPEFLDFKVTARVFDIDWDKIQTVDDIKSLLKGMQLNVHVFSKMIPDHMKEAFEKHFFIERKP
jgi:hypothetical protein